MIGFTSFAGFAGHANTPGRLIRRGFGCSCLSEEFILSLLSLERGRLAWECDDPRSFLETAEVREFWELEGVSDGRKLGEGVGEGMERGNEGRELEEGMEDGWEWRESEEPENGLDPDEKDE